MKPLEYIKHLNNRGIWSFTYQEASEFLSKDATAAIRILRKKGRIIDPARGFYVIIPEEISLTDRLPGDRFIDDLMNFYKAPYYVCLLSAAAYYGSSHQSPQALQVMTHSARRTIQVRNNRIIFHKKKNMSRTPTKIQNTQTGVMKLSTPETTVLDMIQFNHYIGGLDYVATVISEMLNHISSQKLVEACDSYSTPILQRAGYLLDYLGYQKGLDRFRNKIINQNPIFTPLDQPGSKIREPKNKKWKVYVNHTIELDI